jgi:hypothetical protein
MEKSGRLAFLYNQSVQYQHGMVVKVYIIHSNKSRNSFLALTRTADLAKDVARFLVHFNSAYVPELEPNRNIYAFRNGIYYTRKDTFIPYEIEDENRKARLE